MPSKLVAVSRNVLWVSAFLVGMVASLAGRLK